MRSAASTRYCGSSSRGPDLSAPAFNVSASNVTIRGLVIIDFGMGIQLNNSSDSKIQGCFLGVDASGQTAVHNGQGIGGFNDSNLLIGGPAAGDRNLISGNSGFGIQLTNSPGALIQANLVGTTASGDAPLGNGNGMQMQGGTGTMTVQGNVISGNGTGNQGIGVSTGNFGGAHNTVIQGNWIGTDATGLVPVGNKWWGILLGDQNATVGGTAAGQGNVIAYNSGGVGYSCCASMNHSPIRGNSIYSNDALFGGVRGSASISPATVSR